MRGLCALVLSIAAAAAISTACLAQDATPPSAQASSTAPLLAPDALDELVAPVALYPDPLLADVLTAATYPLEVVEADRWAGDSGNASLAGTALTAALDGETWDPSVKSLVPFPEVLQLMDNHLDWMEQLGEAFLAQPDAVMDAVQRMRRRALDAGNLNSASDESVSNEEADIAISPPPSDTIYVPQYDPWCAFGPWPYEVFPPYYFAPWPGDCAQSDAFVTFAAGIALPFAFWDWGYFDWPRHQLRLRPEKYARFHSGHAPKGDQWSHDPSHRAGVPYANPRNSQRFEPQNNQRQSFRGYDGGAPLQIPRGVLQGVRRGAVVAPRQAHPAPPLFESFGSGPVVRMQSQRGMTSRQGGGFARGFGGGAVRGGGPPGRVR